MTAYQKYKNRLEAFLQTPKGKRFIHFMYSIGAAIVILGAMFKLLHFHFGNEMLFIGMITECIVFILSAFDTPVRDYRWEEVFPVLGSHRPEDRPNLSQGIVGTEHVSASGEREQPGRETTDNRSTPQQERAHQVCMDGDTAGNLSERNEEYARQLEELNRKLADLNNIYEIQLKSIDHQINNIEQINRGLSYLKTVYNDAIPDGALIKRETEKMAAQLQELNIVYARMLEAMTVNWGPTGKRVQHFNREQSNEQAER